MKAKMKDYTNEIISNSNIVSFSSKSLKDFEVNAELNLSDRVDSFYEYSLYRTSIQQNNYRVNSLTGSGARMVIKNPYSQEEEEVISFISNDYLGFSRHPKVIESGIEALKKWGSGAGASPLIGGQVIIHDKLEKKMASFLQREDAITFTSGFASNSGILPALLGKKDIAILDTQVHASVIDGCTQTNKKFFLHNNIESLEHALKTTFNEYVDKIIIIDGVYSQDGDIAPLKEIINLAKVYGAYVMVDDAHGIGVFGKSGRGVLEDLELLKEVDIITGTFSKSFGTVGGFVVGDAPIINYLKYYSRLNIFSAAATPQAAASIIKGIELIDEEPIWRDMIHDNVKYFREGLLSLNIDFGKSQSAIFPIMIKDEEKTNLVGKLLFENNIYVNPIVYPAVKRKDSRIRMSILATHKKEDLDKTLNILEYATNKYNIKAKS